MVDPKLKIYILYSIFYHILQDAQKLTVLPITKGLSSWWGAAIFHPKIHPIFSVAGCQDRNTSQEIAGRKPLPLPRTIGSYDNVHDLVGKTVGDYANTYDAMSYPVHQHVSFSAQPCTDNDELDLLSPTVVNRSFDIGGACSATIKHEER